MHSKTAGFLHFKFRLNRSRPLENYNILSVAVAFLALTIFERWWVLFFKEFHNHGTFLKTKVSTLLESFSLNLEGVRFDLEVVQFNFKFFVEKCLICYEECQFWCGNRSTERSSVAALTLKRGQINYLYGSWSWEEQCEAWACWCKAAVSDHRVTKLRFKSKSLRTAVSFPSPEHSA